VRLRTAAVNPARMVAKPHHMIHRQAKAMPQGEHQMGRTTLALATAAIALLVNAGVATAATELRFTCYEDGNECQVMSELLKRFEADNQGITVAVDVVPYKAILESLPVQLAAGEGPDLARVTDLGGLHQYYLDIGPYVDRAYWEENFGTTLPWYRSGPDDDGIYGVMTQLTITGPYINKTLFDQAGVEVPGEGATWDEWTEAARQVAEATETPFPMALDRSGHRLAGPAISMGARFFDADGKLNVVDEGFREAVTRFVEWHQDGTMATDVWGGKGGAAYQDAAQEFINAQLVYYFSGSWQVGQFEEGIADAFDWQVVPPPCGDAGCTGMPGGAGLVGFKDTEHPEEVAKVIDFFASEPVQAELIARTKNVPAHKGLVEKGLEYPDVSPQATAALKAWGQQVADISPIAYQLQGYPNNRAVFNIVVNRVTQAIVGEISTEEALERIDADIAETVKQ
jgi:alpha-1,4-digalacturonate transport system substrate-binding protein